MADVNDASPTEDQLAAARAQMAEAQALMDAAQAVIAQDEAAKANAAALAAIAPLRAVVEGQAFIDTLAALRRLLAAGQANTGAAIEELSKLGAQVLAVPQPATE